MKLFKQNIKTVVLSSLGLIISFTMSAQIGGWNPMLEKEAKAALKTMVSKTPTLKTFCDEAYGYAVFQK
ncbi:lipid-binding SYLF domain-containing protein [Spongiivirga citrea]|uniref:Uncharacterized protein n=1 Tax=Spongiivirga citrea TaxID=1481457 RepID=A0A6M0CFG8_9FLAO|nr:hypothetical protein [Spongiivirga citrea]NER16596.1 hypothetical protein [Spongiivirga citrea]